MICGWQAALQILRIEATVTDSDWRVRISFRVRIEAEETEITTYQIIVSQGFSTDATIHYACRSRLTSEPSLPRELSSGESATEVEILHPCLVKGTHWNQQLPAMSNSRWIPSTVHDCRTSTHHFGAFWSQAAVHSPQAVHRLTPERSPRLFSRIPHSSGTMDHQFDLRDPMNKKWTPGRSSMSNLGPVKSVKSQTLWADALRPLRPFWGYIGVWKFQVYLLYQVKLAIFMGKHDDKSGELGDTYTQFSDQPTKLVAQARQPARKF